MLPVFSPVRPALALVAVLLAERAPAVRAQLEQVETVQ